MGRGQTTLTFVVTAPVWKQPWFVILVGALTLTAGTQSVRVIRRERRLAATNSELEEEIAERERTERERARLVEQLDQLRYLYRLHERLSVARTPADVVMQSGESAAEVLSATVGGRLQIELDGQTHAFGREEEGERLTYHRPLLVGDVERGAFHLSSSIALSEAEDRALVDETVGQITRTIEARELEAQRLQSARLVSMGQVSAGVAHELNQPLTAISTTAGDLYLQAMEGKVPTEAELKEMMGDVVGLTKRLASTINQLRMFSRDESGAPERPFSLDGRVVLEVEDNGVGMDEATAARVFEPFFTTKPAEEGTGLGLSISYAIVRHHDGTIVCRSRVGRGTIFRVELPATQ